MEPDITSWNVKEWQCDGNKKEEQNGYACMWYVVRLLGQTEIKSEGENNAIFWNKLMYWLTWISIIIKQG